MENQRQIRVERRARPRGGRRDDDQKKPWYLRRPLWLATVSLIYVGWRRVRGVGRASEPGAVRNR